MAIAAASHVGATDRLSDWYNLVWQQPGLMRWSFIFTTSLVSSGILFFFPLFESVLKLLRDLQF
jgi:hypothetical protein|uniref:Uncharacterized protein n=1 Tax=Zea mays TaxID=4577 RepID=B4FZ03_MAIZE|nr:unknown [Zea mays]